MISNKIFIDTNIFLRYLTNDDPAMANKIERIFQQALNGKTALVTNAFVIAEIIWVLESFYKRPKEDIENMVSKIMNTKGLEVKDSRLLFKALDLYVSENIDFTDAYIAIYMKQNGWNRILTFDKKHFSRIEGLSVVKL